MECSRIYAGFFFNSLSHSLQYLSNVSKTLLDLLLSQLTRCHMPLQYGSVPYVPCSTIIIIITIGHKLTYLSTNPNPLSWRLGQNMKHLLKNSV